MADRFAALAGFTGGDESAFTASIDASSSHAPPPPPPLVTTTEASGEDADSVDRRDVPARPTIPPRRTISGSGAPHGGARRVPIEQQVDDTPATPKAAAKNALAPNGKAGEPHSTEKKAETKRSYNVRIEEDDSLEHARLRRQTGGGSDASSQEDDENDQSESAELRRMRNDLSTGMDTTQGSASVDDGVVGEIDSGTSLRHRGGGGLVSLKTAQEKIDMLTSERDDLKIEVDFHRKKMSPNAVSVELIELKRKELTWLTREKLFHKNLQSQYTTLKEQKKRNKVLEAKCAQLEAGGGGGEEQMAAKLREVQERADKERRARLKAEDEVALMRQRSHGDSSGTVDSAEIQRLRDENLDFKDDIYRLERENEDLQAQLEEQGTQRDERREEASRALEREHREEMADMKQEMARWRSESDRLQALVDRALQKHEALKSQNDELAQRYDDVEAAKEELMMQLNAADGLGQAAQIENEKRIEETNTYRDRLAAVQIDVESYKSMCDDYEEDKKQADEAIQHLEMELEESERARADIAREFNEEREAGDEIRAEVEELRAELEDLRATLEEAQTIDANLRAELAELDTLVQEREEDCAEANDEIARISKLLLESEQTCEAHVDTIEELEGDREASEERHKLLQETLQEHVQQLKDQLAEKESELHEVVQSLEESDKQRDWLNKQVDELEAERDSFSEKIDEILQDLKKEEEAREEEVARLERDRDDLREDLEGEISDKAAEIKALKREVEKTKVDLSNKEEDLVRLQNALRTREDESVRLGQSQANDKHSLQLEVDRLKRDLSRCETDLERERIESLAREETLKEKEAMLVRLHGEKRDLESKAASESQGRLGLDERFATQQRTLQSTQEDLDAARARLEELEHQLSQGERETLQSEQQIRTQLTERNTLLLSIYQYMGKIIGGQVNTPRKKTDELKPFTNFGVFHDSLLARMRKLSDLQGTFEQRAKDVETKLLEQLTKLKRQQDARFRQLDRFETAVKGAVDKQGQWRARLVTKQGEVDAAKATNSELQAQLSSLRSRQSLESPADRSRNQAMSVRAATSERKLALREKELATLEERAAEQQRRTGELEGKWAARIKELEARCKAAEEKVKLERQGAKEKVAEMSEQKKYLEKQIAETAARSRKIDELKVSNKA